MSVYAEAEIVIDAPIERVWATMVDIRHYPEWNPFVTQIDCAVADPQVGSDFILHVAFKGGQKVKTLERVSRLEPPSDGKALLEYQFLGPLHTLNLVRGKRQQYLQSLPDGRTRYRTTERLTGLLSFAAPIAKVLDGFERHAAALKRRVEAQPAA
ncbi:MAG TPA: SRPBCC domain-containing protein [Solimonas sp.]|nr:SRPBCC domain-containing protein [Solimonas sp.]